MTSDGGYRLLASSCHLLTRVARMGFAKRMGGGMRDADRTRDSHLETGRNTSRSDKREVFLITQNLRLVAIMLRLERAIRIDTEVSSLRFA